ncbi:MAG: prolyl oligopeptidase family serine peptidase [Kiritimatiellae bacterium]|nr:prolyl oligopeptidase family serine peptidase [Kiritimatiellia bacterium]
MKKIILTAMCLCALASLATASEKPAETAADWTTPKVFTGSNGTNFLYRWAAPSSVEPGKKYPLVILFHGAGERGTNNVAQLKWGATEILSYMKKNNIEGYFIAGQVPYAQQWVNTPWGAYSHRMPSKPSLSMSLLLELADKVVAEHQIDKDRIYATGISMGGYGTWDAIQRRPDFFAAAMPVCGGGDKLLAWKLRDIPIWTWHGDKDTVVPFSRSRDMVSALWAVDGKIRYTEVPDCGHGSWLHAYACEEALKWLFSQKRKN